MEFDASLESLMQKWMRRTEGLDPAQLHMPLGVYLREANDLAALADRHLEPLSELGVNYPGLNQLVDGASLTWETATEMRELVFVIGETQARAASEHRSLPKGRLEHARRLRSEWMAALRYLFEARGDHEMLHALKKLRTQHKDQSQKGVAHSLHTIHEFASQYMDDLTRLGRTEQNLAECLRAAQELEERSDERIELRSHRSQALYARNLLVTLLEERVQAVRRAFRYVFRDFGDVLAKAQSEYARQRRRKHLNRQRPTTRPPSSTPRR